MREALLQDIRVAVFFDGSNVYNRLKELGIPLLTQYRYRELAVFLAGEKKVISCHYFVGVVRAKPDAVHGQELRHNQQKLFSHLLEQKFIIERGYLLETNGRYEEKGVDVKMAVDLLVGAYENLYDEAFLITSDTDLIPAITKVKQLGKKIHYVGFAHKPSTAMQRSVNTSRLLHKSEVMEFSTQS